MWVRVLKNDEVRTLVNVNHFYVTSKDNSIDYRRILCTKIDGKEFIIKNYKINDDTSLQNDYLKISKAIIDGDNLVDLFEEV